MKNVAFLLALAYTIRLAIWLLDTPEPAGASARDQSEAFGTVLGRIMFFWLGAAACVMLIRSQLGRKYTGPHHKGLAFLVRFALAFGLCLGGGVAVFAGSSPLRSSREDILLRVLGVGLLLGGAVALGVAFGRTRLARRQRMKMLIDGGADDE